MENRIDFLKTAISDAQELIRFTDAKTAFVITILSAYVIAFFTSIEKHFKYSCSYSCCFWFFFLVFLLLLIICIVVTAIIIKPTNNPTENINFGNSKKPELIFFISPNDYSMGGYMPFYNSKQYKLKENLENYSKQVEGTDDLGIIKSLTFELMKVSYIRNIKNDRLNILLWLLLLTTISFFISYFLFSIEIQEAINCLELTPKNQVFNKP